MDERDAAKIRALIERAVHPGTPRPEAEQSALIACRMLVSKGGLDTLGHARSASPSPASTPWQHAPREPTVYRVDVLLMLVKETKFAYRFALADTHVRRQGAPWTMGWLNKDHVIEITWLAEGEVRKLGINPLQHRLASCVRVSEGGLGWAHAAVAQSRKTGRGKA